MDLTISIVNWNVKDYLRGCLDSIKSHAGGIEHEVIVVDNGSTDGSLEMLRAGYPWAVLIEGRENVGYGCGHNKAIPLAKGRYVLFLDPDTEILPDTLGRALAFMDSHPDTGAIACKEDPSRDAPVKLVVDHTELGRLAWLVCAAVQRRFPNRLTEGFLLRRIIRTAEKAGVVATGGGEEVFFECPDKIRNHLEGAFLLTNRRALDEVGGFDPKYFLGGEGCDLTRRMRELGWRLRYLPYLRVVHHGHKSGAQLSGDRYRTLAAAWDAKDKSGLTPGSLRRAGASGESSLLGPLGRLRESAKSLLQDLAALRRVGQIQETRSAGELVDFAMTGTSGLIRLVQVRSEIVAFVELLKERRPRVILEIGTAWGGTLFLFSRAAGPGATLLSVDLPGGPWGEGESWTERLMRRRLALKGQRIELIRGDSRDPATLARVRKLLGGREADLLFIDGGHSYDVVRSDFELYAPLVRRGGMIALHDVVPQPPETGCEVARLWGELKVRHEHREFVEDWGQEGFGIGLLDGWDPSRFLRQERQNARI